MKSSSRYKGKVHDLKCDYAPFQEVWNSNKFHEVRINDRNFQAGDELVLNELTKEGKGVQFTGRRIRAYVTYMTEGGSYGLPENVVCMSIMVLGRYEVSERAGGY